MARSELDKIRELASQYPSAERAMLFGDHEVFRVNKKVFVWLGDTDDGGTYVGLKLKDSQTAALTLPFTSPMAYGMAKWGWINANSPKGKIPRQLVREWLDESYRHTAPKKLLKLLTAPGATPAPTPPKRRAPPRRAKRSKR